MLINNCVAFMFDEIRYELNGVEIDCNKNVDIITLKNYVSMTYESFDCAERNSRYGRRTF